MGEIFSHLIYFCQHRVKYVVVIVSITYRFSEFWSTVHADRMASNKCSTICAIQVSHYRDMFLNRIDISLALQIAKNYTDILIVQKVMPKKSIVFTMYA